MSPPSPGRRWILLAIKILIVGLVFWFVRKTVYAGVAQLRENPIEISPGWLLLAGVIYPVGLLPAALFWKYVLGRLGQKARLVETLRAYYIGHLGKYVPGKAMVVVLRTGLIRSHRVDTSLAAVSVFFETLTMMSVGAFLATGVLAVGFREQGYLCLVALGLMVAAGLPILPPVFRRLVRLTGVGRSNPAVSEQLAGLGWGTFLLGVVAMTLVWCLLATSLWAVLRAMNVPESDLVSHGPLLLACVSLAMVAGFLSLIPGGAGVRELILAELMVPHFGDVVAVASAVLLRLVWLGGELVLSGVLFVSGLTRSAAEPKKK
ncbi:MAG: flippase-like domain-containing protein [Pirellulales bacterium]|nr:flippase-like domain-containing protein [Pirellulales bacterium]